MFVTRDTGIMVVCGELIKSKFHYDQDNYMRAVYYIKTTGSRWDRCRRTRSSGGSGVRVTVHDRYDGHRGGEKQAAGS